MDHPNSNSSKRRLEMTYKYCLRCKRSYSDRQEFVQETGFVGLQKLSRNRHSEKALELRNCSCGSTLAHLWQLDKSRSFKKLRRLL